MANRKRRMRNNDAEIKLMFVDVRKAHLNAVCDEEVFVELPEEFEKYGRYARLRRWLHGCRKAAPSWEEEYVRRLEEVGFSRGRAAPTTLYNKATHVRLVVHGDDFTFSGTTEELMKVKRAMEDWYSVKFRGIMGSGANDVKEVTILGRKLRWTEDGLEYEADPRHRLEVMKMTGLKDDSNAARGAAIKSKEVTKDDEKELECDEVTDFRAAAARLNYLGLDRSDIQYAVKEICQEMSRPTAWGRKKIKNVARYLVGAERVVWTFGEHEDEEMWIDVMVDSDWAGDLVTRRSTSGGMVVVGGVAVKHWSRSQRGRSLSSPEAEYYAMVTGSAEGLAVQAMAEEMGWKLKARVWTDSSGAKSVAARRGLGKMRHIELKYLWIQEAVNKKRIFVMKVPGKMNPADQLTKAQSRSEYQELVKSAGGEIR